MLREQVATMTRDLAEARGRLTRTQQEVSDWKRRFDDLLARVPLKQIQEQP
jgi:hypothetical protein